MPRVLIADDQPDLLAILADRFRAAGYEVTVARNGAEALALARRDRPDVAVLDVMMPELNGFQVCRTLKQDADLAGTRIVLLTAKDTDADRFWGDEVGADVYITKPAHPADVVTRVEALVRAGSA